MYLCQTIENNQCIHWVQQSNFIYELSQLTFAEANQLIVQTALLFVNAWLWRFLSQQAKR